MTHVTRGCNVSRWHSRQKSPDLFHDALGQVRDTGEYSAVV